MGCFRAWLKKHSGLYCILKLIRQFKNYDFRDYLLSYYIGMQWREFVLPEDIKEVAGAVLAHRLLLNGKARMSHATEEDVIEEIVSKIQVPKL